MLRDGAFTGLAFATAAQLFAVARLGSAIATGWEPVLIWYIVLTLAGTVSAALMYPFIALAWRHGVRGALRTKSR